jgi:ribosomal protein S18 acetylase RimI-like enzyme
VLPTNKKLKRWVQDFVRVAKMTFTIKPLICLDYKSIRDIFSVLFCESEDANFAYAWRHRTRDLSLGIYKNSDLLGFALVVGNKLAFIGIHYQFQSYGLGSLLLKAVLQRAFAACRNIYLTPVDNELVIRWYVKHGFQLTHVGPSATPGLKYLIYNNHRYATRSKA